MLIIFNHHNHQKKFFFIPQYVKQVILDSEGNKKSIGFNMMRFFWFFSPSETTITSSKMLRSSRSFYKTYTHIIAFW